MIKFNLPRKELGCREYQRQRRAKFRLHGICLHCGGTVEQERAGKCLCNSCRETQKIKAALRSKP